MGPRRAAENFAEKFPEAKAVEITLYGSLAQTGRGHLTDVALQKGLAPKRVTLVWSEEALAYHPNGMEFQVPGTEQRWQVFSVGGGELREDPAAEARSLSLLPKKEEDAVVYPQKNMEELLQLLLSEQLLFWQVVEKYEGSAIFDELDFLWGKMQESVREGLEKEGVLPGAIGLERCAREIFARARRLNSTDGRTGLLSAYALAVAEENGSGGQVVTAPTCGSCGVLPAVLYYLQENRKHSHTSILRAMATAGLIGNLIKQNASISGAMVGCQGEIGAACAMAAAAAAQLLGGTGSQIEYAAEMGLEHSLGLTCDPVAGLVQIPCIERNATFAVKALCCAEYAILSDGQHQVSFDQVVEAMLKTGHDIPTLYKESSLGGLAKVLRS